ncbi:hypothetical protein [Comamonas sp.]|uniref:hypothetical protein n=1 Tax=Comamonas sp. TaxID=34028 RepID=UPI00289B995C|nr:hypothetical protein [Comamonas sp.]
MSGQVFNPPSRQTDPVGHAKFWFGAALWQVLIQQAAELRLHLHSGLVPGMSSREALIQLRRLENRNLLVRTAERQGGHIIFILRDKALRDHLMSEVAQRAQQREGQPAQAQPQKDSNQ